MAKSTQTQSATVTKKAEKGSGYYEGIGRRKTATARVRISPASKADIKINEGSLASYFQNPNYEKIAIESFEKANPETKFAVSVHVSGGGKHAQAVAVRHGIARALVMWSNQELRPQLKSFGHLSRDPRMKERKKFGLRGARRARQWRKR